MLVLGRKVGEKLVIGEHITVEVLRIKGNRITLGLVAPAEVRILREELKVFEARQTSVEASVDAELLRAS